MKPFTIHVTCFRLVILARCLIFFSRAGSLEENADLEPRIVRFVIPVGANVSMSGTVAVVSAAAVFLAKLNGLHLGTEEMLIIG